MINFTTTQIRATIAWLSHTARPPSDRMKAALAEAGYAIVDYSTGFHSYACEAAIIDIRGAKTPSVSARELAAIVRRLFLPGGTIVLAPADADRQLRAALRKFGDVCFQSNGYEPLIGAVRERLRLAALAEETGERLKTLIASGRPFKFPSFSPASQQFSVLIAGQPSPLTLNACNAVRRWANETVCVFSAGQVMRALDHAKFNAAVFLPSDENDLLLALARALRRHREHRQMPVLLAADDETRIERLTARDGFECVLADHLQHDLAPRVALSARRAAMAASMRRFLKSAEGLAGKSTPAVNARFFAQHAMRLYQRAGESKRTISLIGLSIEPRVGKIGKDVLGGAMSQVLRTVNQIIRAEDLVGRLTANTLVVLTAGTSLATADRIAERLDGVVSGSLLRSTLEIAAINTAAVERSDGESIEETLVALIRTMKQRQVEALSVS